MERHVIEASDVVTTFKLLAGGKNPWRTNSYEGTKRRRKWAEEMEWYGGTPEQTLGWLQNGYQAPKLDIGHSQDVMAATRRRLKPADDGELQVDLALSGFDMPYLDWSRRPAKPGLRLVAMFNLSCVVNSKDVAAFATWCRSLVGTLATRGYDISLDIAIQCDSLFAGNPFPQEVAVRIKRENEAFDAATWSAFLAPTGFRHLMFTAMIMAAERAGRKITSNLGFPKQPEQEMTFDPTTRRMVVSSYAGQFNADKATAEVASALGMNMGTIDWKAGEQV